MNMQEEMELPRGFRFCPTDKETIKYYLKKKVTGQPLACEGIVLERNPYDEKQLPDIFAAAEKRDIYFFTKLMRKGRAAEGPNFSRTVGDMGTWRSDHTVDIKDKHGSLIGTAKTLGYSEKGSSRKNKLIMTEYALPTKDRYLPYNPSKDWVLCRVKKNGRAKDGKNSGSNSDNINQETPLLVPAADHDLEANAANSDYPSSMVIKEEATTPTNNESSVENGNPGSLNALVALNYHTDNPAALDYHTDNPAALYYHTHNPVAHHSSYPSYMVAESSSTCKIEAAPSSDFQLATGDELPSLKTLGDLGDIDFGVQETLPTMDYNIDYLLKNLTEVESEPFLNG